MQRDEKYYEAPNRFDPSRFSEGKPSDLSCPYMPFGSGKRDCIGRRLGKMQTKVGLLMMLQKCRYELQDHQKNCELEFASKLIFLAPKRHIHLHVFKRNITSNAL